MSDTDELSKSCEREKGSASSKYPNGDPPGASNNGMLTKKSAKRSLMKKNDQPIEVCSISCYIVCVYMYISFDESWSPAISSCNKVRKISCDYNWNDWNRYIN